MILSYYFVVKNTFFNSIKLILYIYIQNFELL